MKHLVDILPGSEPSTRIEVWKNIPAEGPVRIELRMAVDHGGALGWVAQKHFEIDEDQAKLLREALGLAAAVAPLRRPSAPVAAREGNVIHLNTHRRQTA